MLRFTWSSIALILLLCLSCSKEETSDEPAALNLPSGVSGLDYNLQCSFAAAAAPSQVGDQATFSFGSDGSFAIDFNPAANDGAEVSIPTGTQLGNEYIWEDASAGYKYALSLTADDSLNEVNVFDLQDNFLNQWNPIPDGPANLNLIIGFAGTYTVTSVDQGTHSRMTFSIAMDGSIDFDSGLSFSPSDYNLITDRIDVLDGVWIDMKPWPDEPYPRMELFVDPNEASKLVKVIYRPNYPSSSGGAVEINL